MVTTTPHGTLELDLYTLSGKCLTPFREKRPSFADLLITKHQPVVRVMQQKPKSNIDSKASFLEFHLKTKLSFKTEQSDECN